MNINLKNEMDKLYHESLEEENIKKIIAKAVNLGMIYQEQKIKEGIDVAFKALHAR